MLLGFISLLLTVLQNALVKICVTRDFSRHLLPCSRTDYEEAAHAPTTEEHSTVGRRLLNFYYASVEPVVGPMRRSMAEEASAVTGHCARKASLQRVVDIIPKSCVETIPSEQTKLSNFVVNGNDTCTLRTTTEVVHSPDKTG